MKKVVMGMMCGLLLSTGEAAQRFVRTSGNNGADGATRATAWQSIAYANTRLTAGDTLLIGEGTYTEAIAPSNSGASGRPIVYRPYGSETVRFTGAAGASLVGRGFIVLEGLRFENVVGSAIWLQDCDEVVIQRCRVYNVAAWAAIKGFGVRRCRIQYNWVDRADTTGGTTDKDGDGIHISAWHPGLGSLPTHNNLIRGNFVTRCFHSAIGLDPSVMQHHNIVDSNYLYVNHNGIDNSGEYNVVQRNFLWKSAGVLGRGGDCLGLKALCNYTIARYNVVIDDSSNPAQDLNYRGVAVCGTWLNTGAAQHNRVYHNTFYFSSDEKSVEGKYPFWNGVDNGSPADSISDFRFVNNIFYRNILGAPIIYLKDPYRPASRFTSVFENNVFHKDTGSCVVQWSTADLASAMSLADAQRVSPACWRPSNKDVALTWADEGRRDLRPDASSYAVDRGSALTTTAAAGSGSTSVDVGEASWFMDGYGMVTGDSIKIEGAAAVGVVAINGNTLTLSAARSWTAGARVWHYRADKFQGAAPDIGALEYDGVFVGKRSPNVLANPSFEAGFDAWEFFSDAPGTITLDASEGGGSPFARINLGGGGANIQLYQPGIALLPATSYRLRFRARSTTGHALSVSVHKHTAPYTEYGLLGCEFALTPAWTTFEVDFTTRNVDAVLSDARLTFWLAGYASAGDEYAIDDVELTSSESPNSVELAAGAPRSYALLQNYPNPFNPTTRIAFDLPHQGATTLKVYDALGAEVATLLSEVLPAGRHETRWSADRFASGVYYCRLESAGTRATVKLLLMK